MQGVFKATNMSKGVTSNWFCELRGSIYIYIYSYISFFSETVVIERFFLLVTKKFHFK